MNIQLKWGGVLMVMTLVDFGGFLARSLLSFAYKSSLFLNKFIIKKAIKPTS
jgi:hypothetical protein